MNARSFFCAPVALLASMLSVVACSGVDANEDHDSTADGGTHGDGGVISGDIDYAKLPAGTFALTLKNETNGKWRDDQVFIGIIGVDGVGGNVTYAMPTKANVTHAPEGATGVLAQVKRGTEADNQAPNCLKAGAACFANYSFTLADLKADKTLFLPGDGKYYGSRIYISLGKPMYQEVSPDGKGISQPNLESNADPNYDTPFDWFEFTYDPQLNPKIPFGGNITQVDLYSIPLSFDVAGVNGTKIRRGITMGPGSSAGVSTQAELVAKYQSFVGPAFKNLLQKDRDGKVVRFVAPYHGPNFLEGGSDIHYFDGYVNDVWKQFTEQPSTLDFYDQDNKFGNHYTGCKPDAAHEGQICFMYETADKRVKTGPWYMEKPTTYDVLQNGGKLQPGCRSTKELNECNAFGAQMAGALNRAVAGEPQSWLKAATFYKKGPKNDWAEFWHAVSIDGRAYGMGFDDTGDQSSVAILPVEENVRTVTIGIGW